MTDKLIGTKPYQVPSNADLGDTAFQDASYVNIGGVAKFDQLSAQQSDFAIATTKPTIEPSLLLDFANSETVDSRITFTRESIATRTNRFGLIETVDWNVPRIDYDPITGDCNGFLIEEARTNLFPNNSNLSSQFSNYVGTVTDTITNNAAVAPDGSMSASLWQLDGQVLRHTLSHMNSTLAASTKYTVSVYLKKYLNIDKVCVQTRNYVNWTDPGGFNFEFSTKTVSANDSCTSFGAQELNDGWFRVWFTCDRNTGLGSTGFYISAYEYDENGLVINSGVSSYPEGSGVYFWGAQIEAGSFPTSYIPTSGTAVTREWDFPSIPLSTWFNATEGTMYSDFSTYDKDGFRLFYAGTSTNGTPHLTKSTGGFYGACFGDNGSITINNNVPFPGSAKVAYAYKSGNSAVAVNDSITTNADISTFAFNSTAYIGNANDGISLNGHIKKLVYYPKRVSDTELQALTRI